MVDDLLIEDDIMGKINRYLGPVPGYFKTDRETEFPWSSTDRSIWFALFVVEDREICWYGFTPSKSSKHNLIKALKALTSQDKAILIGIWTGKYRTDLFVLDIEKSIIELEKVL